MKTENHKNRSSSRWNWALPALFLLLGITSLHSGITGRGHYDRKHRYYYSAKEDVAIGIVSLIGCGYCILVLLRNPEKKK